MRTFPVGSTTPLRAELRATFIAPVGTHIPVFGSYSSALGSGSVGVVPPATSTLPFGRSVTDWACRGVRMLPVIDQATVGGPKKSTAVKHAGAGPHASLGWPL